MRIRSRPVINSAILACILPLSVQAAPPSGSYKLVMADTFDESTLDTMKWGYNYPWSNQHNHQGYMTPERVVVNNGVVDLEAKTGRHPNAVDFWRDDFGWQEVNYTTGAIHTSGKLNITRGYIEVSAKLYGSIGSWPAIWMLGNGWPPEIDIMEFPRGTANGISNNNNTAIFNYHYTNNSGNNASYYKRDTALPTLTDGFHTYALEWTSSVMNFYVDGSLRHSVTDSAAIADAQNMYLLLNNGVGGWAGDVTGQFESHFWIDSVKVWQIPGASDHTWKQTAASGSWDTGGNWSTNLVPRFEDTVARFQANDNAAVAVSWNDSNTIGGLHFDTQTTAYTIGSSSGSLQFAKAASNANGTIFMTAATSLPQTVASRVELYDGVTVTNNSTAAPLTLSGTIIGSGGLQKAGPGMLVLSGSNTFRGGLGSISGGSVGDLGVIRLMNSNAAGTGVVNLPASNASSIVVELYGDLNVSNNLTTAGRSNFTFLRSARGDSTWSGDITINALGGGYAIEAGAGTSLALNGTLSTTVSSASDRVFNLIGSGTGVINGAVNDGTTTKVGLAKAGTGNWTLKNANTYSAGTTVTAGKLIAAAAGSLGSGAVTVNGGELRIEHAAALHPLSTVSVSDGSIVFAPGLTAAVVVPTLALSGTGFVELADNRLILNHAEGDEAQTLSFVTSSLASGAIRSGTAVADSRKSIGFGSAATLGLGSFGDVALDGSAMLLGVTFKGDTNLDGDVDFDDLLVLAQNYGADADKSWVQGDFDLSGIVAFDDLLAMAQNYSASGLNLDDVVSPNPHFAADWALARSLVPEPTSLLAVFALTCLRRRRSTLR